MENILVFISIYYLFSFIYYLSSILNSQNCTLKPPEMERMGEYVELSDVAKL